MFFIVTQISYITVFCYIVFVLINHKRIIQYNFYNQTHIVSSDQNLSLVKRHSFKAKWENVYISRKASNIISNLLSFIYYMLYGL